MICLLEFEFEFTISPFVRDVIFPSNDSLFLGGRPGPRLLLGGGIDDDRLNEDDFVSSREDQVDFLLPDEDEDGGVGVPEDSPFSPFFFLVVNVLGLSSVYIVVGVRCRLGLLRLMAGGLPGGNAVFKMGF